MYQSSFNRSLIIFVSYIVLFFSFFISTSVSADLQIMAVGIDRKFSYSQSEKKYVWFEPGNDEVVFYDISKPAKPKLLGAVEVDNSILGPPTNIAISPTQKLALIGNAASTVKNQNNWSMKPSNKITIIDLSSGFPTVSSEITVGNMPSGISFNQKGDMALAVNRRDSTVSVLSIEGATVEVVDTVFLEGTVTGVAIAPDGRSAFVVNYESHLVEVLNIDEENKVTHSGESLPVGLYPWAITVSTDGTKAVVTNIGKNSASDGNADSITMIDITQKPFKVIQHLTVGDAPEGVVISPNSRYAAVSLLDGSFAAPKDAWFISPMES